ncbi:hypothetical protein SLS54_008036 [Diplodia seriata]
MALGTIMELPLASIASLVGVSIATAMVSRIFYNLYVHPLAKFHGPWYAASFSLCGAIISVLRVEPQWLMSLTKRYGSPFSSILNDMPSTANNFEADKPIRIAPNLLLFPMASAVKDIYWDAKCNTKAPLYGTGALGPPHLFTTLDGEEHRALRKALGGSQWTIGGLKNAWEPRIDELVQLFIRRLAERAEANETVTISDKVAEFAADVMTMLSFGEPWGFVANSRDERAMLRSWRAGLDFFGFVGRFRWFRDVVIPTRVGARLFLPSVADDSGMGYLMSQADGAVAERERRIENEGFAQEKPDFLQQ